MTSRIAISCFVLFSTTVGFSQNKGQLILNETELSGKLNHRYFKGFTIELDSTYTQLDSAMLFGQLPRLGTINFKNRNEIPTEYTLTARAGYPQIMFRFRSNYLTFDSLIISDQSVSFAVDDDPEVPVTEQDLEIIRLTKSILSESKYWHKHDDRHCEDDLANKSYSIYCAIRLASIEIENKYNHRNATLQKLRHIIEENNPGRKWNHRLVEFNNMEATNFNDIINVLDEIENDFLLELKEKKNE